MVWVGAPDAYAQKSTADANAQVWACVDTNTNGICDGNEAAARTCENAGGSWYNGACCNAQTGCGFNAEANAFCGNNLQQKWGWVPVNQPGEIHVLDNCPGASLLSDGTAVYSCGKNAQGAQAFGNFRNVTIGNATHGYSCVGSTITECAGPQEKAFSTSNTVSTGTVSTGFLIPYYCASDGDWTPDLDAKDEESCAAAGFTSTGTHCCSEADDPAEYYNDPLGFAPAISALIVDNASTAQVSGNSVVLDANGAWVEFKGPVRLTMTTESQWDSNGVISTCKVVESRIIDVGSGETRYILNSEPKPSDPAGTSCTLRKINISVVSLPGAGGCWNKGFIASAAYVVPQKVVNYHCLSRAPRAATAKVRVSLRAVAPRSALGF
jgi:hypothetical protein